MQRQKLKYFYRTKEDSPSVCKWNIIEVSFYFCGSNQNWLNLFYYLSEGGCQILAHIYPNRVESTRRARNSYMRKILYNIWIALKHQKLNYLIVYETTSWKCFSSEMWFFFISLKSKPREGGLGWGTHVNPWLFHFNVWQNPPQIKKKKK